MLIRKIFVTFTSAANYWFKATFAHVDTAGGKVEMCIGQKITTSASGSSALISTDGDHGLVVGQPVRVVGHFSTAAPSAAPLIDPASLYVVQTTPSSSTLTINATTASAGAGGYIGSHTLDHIDLATVAMIALSDNNVFPPGEDRVG